MGLQRAGVLYPVNTTTVDTGTGVDMRLLDSAQAGATDTSQSVTATHTQDNTTRIFDPASASNAGTLSFGYALRLAEDMTPADANCDAILVAQTATVTMRVAVNQSGGTYVTGSYAPEWRAALVRYNVVTNVATIIGVLGTHTTTSWNYTPATGDLGTFKNVTISVSLPSAIEFAANEVLGLVLGVNTLTIPNPTLGTATWTFTLAVDDANTFIAFETDKSLRQICRYELDAAGTGVAALGRRTVSKAIKATGVGLVAIQRHIRLAAKTATAVGVASIAKYVRIAAPKLATGVGVAGEDNYIRLAAKTATGTGVASEDNYIRLAAKTVTAVGVAAFSKFVEAFRQFSVTAVGVVGFARAFIGVRLLVVTAIGVAGLFVKIAQNIINRMTGGGTTTIVHPYPTVDD